MISKTGLSDNHAIFDVLENVPSQELHYGDRENQPKVESHGYEHLTVVEYSQQEVVK